MPEPTDHLTDRERLDWLETNEAAELFFSSKLAYWTVTGTEGVGTARSLRHAIDNAARDATTRPARKVARK